MNDEIQSPTRDTLFDEKIGGTCHVALGMAFPECGGTNTSGLHWDLVCDLRRGGEIHADGEVDVTRRAVRVSDPRIQRLADVIVNFSLELGEGDTVLIQGPAMAEELIVELVRTATRVGAIARVRASVQGTDEAYLARARATSSSTTCRRGRSRRWARSTRASRCTRRGTRGSSRRSIRRRSRAGRARRSRSCRSSWSARHRGSCAGA